MTKHAPSLCTVLFTVISVTLHAGCSCDPDERQHVADDAGTDSGRAGAPEPDAARDAKAPPPPDATPDARADAGAPDLFAAWRQIQGALRKSPDHLPARADALVASKDPKALFDFVRDEIATYPPSRSSE